MDLLTTVEAARRLGIPTREVLRLIDQGHLPLVWDDQQRMGVPEVAVLNRLRGEATPPS